MQWAIIYQRQGSNFRIDLFSPRKRSDYLLVPASLQTSLPSKTRIQSVMDTPPKGASPNVTTPWEVNDREQGGRNDGERWQAHPVGSPDSHQRPDIFLFV